MHWEPPEQRMNLPPSEPALLLLLSILQCRTVEKSHHCTFLKNALMNQQKLRQETLDKMKEISQNLKSGQHSCLTSVQWGFQY